MKKKIATSPLSKAIKSPARKGAAVNPRGQSLAELAYIEIRNQILRGELPFGVAIARRKLAESLNISVPPVTEALQRLERDGLVESKPQVGTRVRIPTRDDVEDRSFLREALETQAARLFSERATAEEKKELSQMGRRVDQLYAACEESSDDREFLFSVNSYHMKLHLHIAACARCPSLREAIEKEQVLIFNWLYDTAVQRRILGSDFHARLTDVLARGTPDEAGEAMRAHIRHGLQEVLSGLDRMAQMESGWRHKKSS
ncbi:MAG: GntR family transcriptional regulator [Verrucomicrobiota bacterium]